eukprot:scaffold40153_cov61-Phaeocystis_antarctica.AAC.3
MRTAAPLEAGQSCAHRSQAAPVSHRSWRCADSSCSTFRESRAARMQALLRHWPRRRCGRPRRECGQCPARHSDNRASSAASPRSRRSASAAGAEPLTALASYPVAA